MKDVDRRFGRISGTLALVYIAVFAKFGLWQALTERCCGTVETAGVGTAIALIVTGRVGSVPPLSSPNYLTKERQIT